MPDGEIAWWAEHNDPITRYERYLEENNILTRDAMEAMAKEIKTFLDAEANRADAEPDPIAETAAYDVYDNSVVAPAFKKKLLI